MEVVELNVLNSAHASDFVIQHVVGSGQNGLVMAARCTCKGLPSPDKLYALKLLFNFTHEYSSVVRNTYENEWLVLSRLMPHRNVVRFWAQFISPIPDSLAELLPAEVRKFASYKNKAGEVVQRKGQFLVLDYHPQNLYERLSQLPSPLPYETTLKLTEQLMEAVLYLEGNKIRHLDLKLRNLLVTDDDVIVLCDFGCAVQFLDDAFTLRYARGMVPGGNRAHLAPEVLSSSHRCRADPSKDGYIDYSKQTSFAVGILVYEVALGEHPLPDYPLGFSRNGLVSYSTRDIPHLPASYPKSFCSIVADMLHPSAAKRLSMEEARNQLRVCCLRKSSNSSLSSLQAQLERARQERDLAKTKLSVVAAERDFAMSEMHKMAEQCQTVAGEFERMASHCEQLAKQLQQVRHERDSAVKASESAYEASEMLKEQVTMVARERDLARMQVEELREITSSQRPLEEAISECGRCRGFFLQSQNTPTSCHWHPGRHLFNRWSCCYKRAANAIGCKTAAHIT